MTVIFGFFIYITYSFADAIERPKSSKNNLPTEVINLANVVINGEFKNVWKQPITLPHKLRACFPKALEEENDAVEGIFLNLIMLQY